MGKVFEFKAKHGTVTIEAHDSHHVFMHTGCVSSQMTPKLVSVRFFEYFDTQYLEISDSESGFVQGFELPQDIDLRDVSRFFLDAYGFTPRHEGCLACMPFKGVDTVDSIRLSSEDNKGAFTFSLIRSNHIMVQREGFYGVYPAQKVGINAQENTLDNTQMLLSLTTVERNVSHISLYLRDSKQRFEHFLDKYRQPTD